MKDDWPVVIAGQCLIHRLRMEQLCEAGFAGFDAVAAKCVTSSSSTVVNSLQLSQISCGQ